MKYILEGNEKDVRKVVRENRIRAERGLVTFTPVSESEQDIPEDKEPVDDDKYIDGDVPGGDKKDIEKDDVKKPKGKKK